MNIWIFRRRDTDFNKKISGSVQGHRFYVLYVTVSVQKFCRQFVMELNSLIGYFVTIGLLTRITQCLFCARIQNANEIYGDTLTN